MECYTIEFLRMACKDYHIPHSRLSKKEMYDKLVEINAICKDPRENEPTPIHRKRQVEEKYYLGEEYRS